MDDGGLMTDDDCGLMNSTIWLLGDGVWVADIGWWTVGGDRCMRSTGWRIMRDGRWLMVDDWFMVGG